MQDFVATLATGIDPVSRALNVDIPLGIVESDK